MRDRVEDPPQLSGAHVIGANMTGRRASATEDNEVFVDHAGRIDVHRYRAWISSKVLTQVDLAGIAETFDQFSGVGIYRNQSIARGEQNPLISSVGPIANAAQSPIAANRCSLSRIVDPVLRAGGRTETENAPLRRGEIHASFDDDGVTFHVVGRGAITGFKRPRDPQAFDVRCIDLIERRIVCSVRIAMINGPVRTRSLGACSGGMGLSVRPLYLA